MTCTIYKSTLNDYGLHLHYGPHPAVLTGNFKRFLITKFQIDIWIKDNNPINLNSDNQSTKIPNKVLPKQGNKNCAFKFIHKHIQELLIRLYPKK